MSYQNYGSAPPELSNNPFIDHPSNALNRYPDINGTDAPTGTTSQFTSWLQPQGSSNYTAGGTGGYTPTGQPQQQGYNGGYQAQQQTGWSGSSGGYPQQQQQASYNSGYVSPVQAQPTGRPFQPSSSFGQQLHGQVAAAYSQPAVSPQPQQIPQYPTGYPPQQQQQPQYGNAYAYGQQQPLQPQQTAYAPEFDPYASQAQAQQQPSQTQAQTSAASANSGYRAPHPRDFIQQNKAQMEAWDTYAWKQALNCFDGLKDAWTTRKMEVEARIRVMGGQGLFGGGGGGGYGGYGGYGANAYSSGQELNRLEQLAKDAEQNADTVVAAKFQMQEVQTGYRQSGDLASKKRVRESINAALTNLPDWPSQSF